MIGLKRIFTSLSTQSKIIISIIFGISILVTICAFILVQNIQSNIDREVSRLNVNLKNAQILANVSSHVLLLDFKDIESRKQRLQSLVDDFLRSHKNISYVIFTDNAGNVLYQTKYAEIYGIIKNQTKLNPPAHVPFIKVTNSTSGKILTIAEPIQYNSNFFGWVWIGVPDVGFTIVGSKNEFFLFLFEIFLFVWILSLIGAITNSLIIIRPLRKLEKAAKVITEGRFGFQLPLKGFLGRELTMLVKAFNKMSKRLQQYEESNLSILSSERNKFESVVMSIADGVIVFDREDQIQITNPQAARLLSRSHDELIGQLITTIWDINTNERILHYLKSLKLNLNSSLFEFATFEITKDKRNLKLLITPLYDSNQEHLGAVIVIQDRTKEAEIDLIKQEFISNVSHELRTPITSIKCYVDTLCSHQTKIDEPTKTEFLAIVNEETDRLSDLVNDVLELSRLESPASKLQLTLQEIYPCFEYALKSIQVLAHKRSIKLIQDIEKDLPELNINKENIERVLINLLSNAIKYTPGNGTVRFLARRVKNNVLFQVIDNGIGIKEEHIPLLFERFYRVENKVHTVKGTGLGLAIVKKSIEGHEGKISVRSKFGEGSIFEFNLPIPEVIQKIREPESILLSKTA